MFLSRLRALVSRRFNSACSWWANLAPRWMCLAARAIPSTPPSHPVILTFCLLSPSVGFPSSFTAVKSSPSLDLGSSPSSCPVSSSVLSLLPVSAAWVSCLPMILLSSSAVSYLPIQLACYELNCVPLVHMLKSLVPVPQHDGI